MIPRDKALISWVQLEHVRTKRIRTQLLHDLGHRIAMSGDQYDCASIIRQHLIDESLNVGGVDLDDWKAEMIGQGLHRLLGTEELSCINRRYAGIPCDVNQGLSSCLPSCV